MDDRQKAYLIVNRMMTDDEFSRWLGIEVLEVDVGFCKLSMNVRDEMVNGFGFAHGGVAFALADSAMAFASNSHGRVAVAVSTSIVYPNAIRVGDELIATATEKKLGNSTGFYSVSVTCDGISVAEFHGTVHRLSKQHEL